jgi:AraC-like DNA-binding protein/mannose-6-phosphate isomerase-like protein (cupin superfamily)
MRIKGYEELLELFNQISDVEEYFLKKQKETSARELPFKNEQLMDSSINLIIKSDPEGISTSYPNTEVRESQFAIRRKYRYIPILQHRHEYIEMVYVLEGSYIQHIKGQRIKMSKGDLCILDKNVIHESSPLTDKDVAVNIILTPEFFNSIFMQLLSDDNYISNFIINSLYSKSKSQKYLKHYVEDGSILKIILENLLFEYFSSNRSRAAINGYFLILFTELSRELSVSTNEALMDEQQKVKEQIFAYMNENYRTINLNQISDHFNFHPSYMSSLIKKEFGKNLKDILTEIRMSEACKLLKFSDMTIENIVTEIGYSDNSYFYKIFKKTYGMTPLDYKKKSNLTNK